MEILQLLDLSLSLVPQIADAIVDHRLILLLVIYVLVNLLDLLFVYVMLQFNLPLLVSYLKSHTEITTFRLLLD